MPFLSPVLHLTRLAGLGGFLLGGVIAALEIARRPFVLEFQTGGAAGFSERALAIVQRAAVEGLGLGLVTLVLGLLAALLALPGSRRSPIPPSRRLAGSLLLVLAAFGAWLGVGASLLDAAIPFLATGERLATQLLGLLAVALGLGAFGAVAHRLPGSRSDEPVARTLATLIGVSAALLAARAILRSGGEWSDPQRLVPALLCPLLALPLASRLAGILAPLVSAARERLAGRVRLPRRVELALGAGLLVATVVGRPFLGLSPIPAEVRYPRLADRGSPEGPNVVLVVIDALRADHLSGYGYPRPTSPFLDSLAAEGTRFADPVAPAAWTKPATGTILTGLYPSRHGALYHGSSLNLPEGGRTLAECFSQLGYVTGAFVTNPNIKRVFDFDRGFDEYFDSPAEDTISRASLRESYFGRILTAFTGLQFNWKYENDVRQLNRHVFAWLEENASERFFLYLHYIDPHEPYAPPAEYVEPFARDHDGFPLFEERKRLVGIDRYDGEIRYADDGMKELVDELKRRGVWEDTLFVLTSDHGEEFFEHGVLGHGFSVYQPVIRVPLIFHGPGVARGEVVAEPTQIVDLPATLLELAGAEVTELGDGRSFAAAVRGEGPPAPALVHVENEFGRDEDDRRSYVFHSVREGKWKLVLTEASENRPPGDPRFGPLELYDLASDPAEKVNRIADPELGELRTRLLDELRAHATWLDENGLRGSAPAEIDPATEAALRALGYASDAE